MTSINLLFFAQLRERAGMAALVVEMAQPVSVAELKRHLVSTKKVPSDCFDGNVLCAVAQTLVDDSHIIELGQEVAFFPPVTGG